MTTKLQKLSKRYETENVAETREAQNTKMIPNVAPSNNHFVAYVAFSHHET